jgi:hypothetical protein
MRLGGTFVVLAVAVLAIGYGACAELRVDGGSDAGAESPADDDASPTKKRPTRDAGEDTDAAEAVEDDAGRDSAVSDASSTAWPCPAAPFTTTLDREWATGPLPPATPGTANYALKTATVCDKTTLLEWERKSLAQLRTWDDAKAYCDSLSLGGATDWRLPTRIELLSLVDHSRANPAIDPVVFPSTPDDGFWTSTIMFGVFNEPNAYYVEVSFGSGVPYTKTEPLHVRCVRGGR